MVIYFPALWKYLRVKATYEPKGPFLSVSDFTLAPLSNPVNPDRLKIAVYLLSAGSTKAFPVTYASYQTKEEK